MNKAFLLLDLILLLGIYYYPQLKNALEAWKEYSDKIYRLSYGVWHGSSTEDAAIRRLYGKEIQRGNWFKEVDNIIERAFDPIALPTPRAPLPSRRDPIIERELRNKASAFTEQDPFDYIAGYTTNTSPLLATPSPTKET